MLLRYIRKISPLFLLLLLLAFCLSAPRAPQTLLEALSLTPEAVQSVYLSYGKYRVPLRKADQSELLAIFAAAQRRPQREEAQGWRPSDYTVHLVTDRQTYDLTLYWFTGRNEQYAYADRRFDAEWQGHYYSFEQPQERYWNEDVVTATFQQAAAASGLGERWELDGYAGRLTLIDQGPLAGLDALTSTPEAIMDQADVVLTADFTGEYRCNDRGWRVPLFKVAEVWKAAAALPKAILLQSSLPYGETVREGKTYILYPPAEAPAFREGERVLLCLLDTAEGYYLVNPVCGSARLWGSTTFPRYNTQVHPFYGQSVEALRAYVS